MEPGNEATVRALETRGFLTCSNDVLQLEFFREAEEGRLVTSDDGESLPNSPAPWNSTSSTGGLTGASETMTTPAGVLQLEKTSLNPFTGIGHFTAQSPHCTLIYA